MPLDAPVFRIDAGEDIGVNPSTETPIGTIVAKHLSRRDALRGLLAGAAVAGLAGTMTSRVALAAGSTLAFTEIPHGPKPDHEVAPGYRADVLIRWGDPIIADAPAFESAARAPPSSQAVRLQQRFRRLHAAAASARPTPITGCSG